MSIVVVVAVLEFEGGNLYGESKKWVGVCLV